jgi:hypothetical protein
MSGANSLKVIVAAVLCLFAVCVGCDSGNHGDSNTPTAKKIFSEPQQLRLADAVAHGSPESISEAIRLGADIDAPGRSGIQMLMWAMLAGSVDGFRMLLDHDANLMADHFNPEVMRLGQKKRTVAEYVCVFPDKRFLETMLARGFDPNSIVDPKSGETVLFYAVFRHDLQAVSKLVDAGANVNVRDSYERGPLALAVSVRDYRIAMHLLSRGGDPLMKDQAGFSVIDSLKRYGSRGVIPEQKPDFDLFVAELVKRGLLTHKDIIEADKPKLVPPGFEDSPPGITVIEHSPDSEAGQAILELDRLEREANERARR